MMSNGLSCLAQMLEHVVPAPQIAAPPSDAREHETDSWRDGLGRRYERCRISLNAWIGRRFARWWRSRRETPAGVSRQLTPAHPAHSG